MCNARDTDAYLCLICNAHDGTICGRCKQTIDNTDIDKNTQMLIPLEEKTLEEQLVNVKRKVEEAKEIRNWSTRASRLKQVSYRKERERERKRERER